MAVSISTTSERWLRGLDRLVAATLELMPSIPLPSRPSHTVSGRWVMERGPAVATSSVDVLGGFPGSLRSMNRLCASTLLVTNQYLVIGEGAPEGFALPMQNVFAAGLVRPSAQANPGVVIRYQDGTTVGTFALNMRGLARGRSGRTRAADVLHALDANGVPILPADQLPCSPGLAITWDEARERTGEELVWSGAASGSVGGWFGATQDICRMWLTSESLFWSCAEGEGVNRLSLANILEARDGAANRVMISLRNQADQRFDIAFDLAADRQRDPRRQRMSLLNALASFGVPVSSVRPALAPWRRGGMVRPTDR